MFVTVPPLISVAKMTPRFGRWLVDLAWVRFVTGKPQKPSIPTMGVNHTIIPFAVPDNRSSMSDMRESSSKSKDKDSLGTYQAIPLRL